MGRMWPVKRASAIFIPFVLILVVLISNSFASLFKRARKFDHVSNKKLLDQRGREFAYKSIRIPKDVAPIHYDLFLHPNLTSLKFEGKVEILLKCFKATSKVIFHMKDLKTQRIKFADDQGQEIKPNDVSENEEHNLVVLELEKKLMKNKDYRLVIDFNGKLADNMEGFYKSEYKTTSGEKRVLATTQFEPVYARRAFPCFDEPDFKATFEIKILRSHEHRSISNMPLKTTTKTRNGLFLDHFQRSVKMSTYLVAFVVSDFGFTETRTKNGIRVRVWSKKGALNETKFGLDVAQHVLTYYERFFNIKYPLPKMDLIAVPDFLAGAMENWGLVTFREDLLLFNPKSGSAGDKQYVAIVIAHELAHQWFGNLVTMKWWNDLWLNEGFANYVEYIGTDDYAKEWRVLEQFASDTFQSALDADGIINTHPISVPVHNPTEINEIFDGISYEKGSSVIRMLRSFLGDRAFRKGLELYLKKHAYGNAEADDLWHALSKVSSLNIKAIMDSWIKQKGYPVVTLRSSKTVAKSNVNEKIMVKQERFLVHPSPQNVSRKSQIRKYKWYIPLTFITQDSRKQHVLWINQTSQDSFSVKKAGWLKANVEHMGLYRVNYDEVNWELIANQLMQDHNVLSPVDRSGLLDDAFNLARAGLLKMTVPLKLTQYLNKEREYFPWSSATSSLAYIGDMMSMTEAYGLYEKYMLKKLKPLELLLKWEDKGTMLDKYLRAIVLSSLCSHGDQGCVDIAQDLFTKFVDNDAKISISPHLRSTVYSTVVKHGGTPEWEFLWSKYTEETDATHKNKIMRGLTSATQPWLLMRLLKYAVDGKNIRQQDMTHLIIGVSGNPVGRLLAWEFYKENFDKIIKRVGKDSNDYGTLLEKTTQHFNKNSQLEEFGPRPRKVQLEKKLICDWLLRTYQDGGLLSIEDNFQQCIRIPVNIEVQDFIKKHSSVLSPIRASKKAVENIKTNISWMKTHYDTAFKWLKEVDND